MYFLISLFSFGYAMNERCVLSLEMRSTLEMIETHSNDELMIILKSHEIR